MELIRGQKGRSRIDELNREALKQCESVDAAIAYVSEERTLLDRCWNGKVPLTLWARYDHSIPVSVSILENFLRRNSLNYVCKLVPDRYHPKVIWWRKFGAYVGSANLSNPAWFENFEAGVFFSEDELIEQDLAGDLEAFFEEVDDASEPLTEETLRNLKEWRNDQSFRAWLKAQAEFEKVRRLPPRKGLSDITKSGVNARKQKEFLREWDATLQCLRLIAERVSTDRYRPHWVPASTPAGTQADQFLHAFYYNRVRDGNHYPFTEWYHRNKGDRERALLDQMAWWARLKKPPGTELDAITEWAPIVRKAMTRQRIRDIGEDEFVEMCMCVHAVRDHSLRVKNETIGRSKSLPPMEGEERRQLVARWLFKQRAKNGDSPLKMLEYVLYGGPADLTPDRMFAACNDPQRKIPHFGVSTIGEIVGWALPDKFPPRNGRTSKALTALGYRVTIHSGAGSE